MKCFVAHTATHETFYDEADAIGSRLQEQERLKAKLQHHCIPLIRIKTRKLLINLQRGKRVNRGGKDKVGSFVTDDNLCSSPIS